MTMPEWDSRPRPVLQGSTAVQAGGGAAGAIIVEDAANTLPASVAALEEMVFVMAHLNMPALTVGRCASTQARTHARTHARMHARTHARMHTRVRAPHTHEPCG